MRDDIIKVVDPSLITCLLSESSEDMTLLPTIEVLV